MKERSNWLLFTIFGLTSITLGLIVPKPEQLQLGKDGGAILIRSNPSNPTIIWSSINRNVCLCSIPADNEDYSGLVCIWDEKLKECVIKGR